MSPTQKRYDKAFKARAVQMCLDGMPMKKVAETLKVSALSVCTWCHEVGFHGKTRRERGEKKKAEAEAKKRQSESMFPRQREDDREYFARVLERLRPFVKEASEEYRRRVSEGENFDRGFWQNGENSDGKEESGK